MKKKITAAFMVTILMATSLAGCASKNQETASDNSNNTAMSSSSNEKQETVTLTVWRQKMTDERTTLIESLNAQFMKENPNIKIEFTAMPDSFDQKLDLALANGSGPDVIVSPTNLAPLIENNYVISLDDLYDNWSGKDNMVTSMVDSIRGIDIKEKKLYGIPEGANINCLWIRPDWFKSAGIDIPVTWEDVFSDVEKLTDTSKDQYGVGLRGGQGSAANLEMMMFSYAGITDYFDANGKCNIRDPKMVEFVQRWLGQYGKYSAEGDIGNGWTELAATFQSGRSAVIQHNLGSASGHMTAFNSDTSKFEAIPFPKSVDGTVVNPPLTYSATCISSTCENVDAAFKYITWISSGEANSSRCELWSELPVDKTVLENADWIKNTSWMKMGAETLLSDDTKFYNSPAYLASYGSILTNDVEPMVQAVMSGDMTAQEMCDNWAALIEQAKSEADAE